MGGTDSQRSLVRRRLSRADSTAAAAAAVVADEAKRQARSQPNCYVLRDNRTGNERASSTTVLILGGDTFWYVLGSLCS